MNEENKNLEETMKRHIDVILEHMDNRFDAIAEGQAMMGEKVELLGEKVELLIEDMDQVKSSIVEIRSDIVEIRSDIVGIRSDIGEINAKLDKKADKNAVEDHEVRIVKLEKAAGVA